MLDSSSGGLRWAELLQFAVVALGACWGLARALWLPGGWYLHRICTVWWYPLRLCQVLWALFFLLVFRLTWPAGLLDL